jgi:exosome complex RNA-binding protein Rrp42 (RNase PH superfamily)
MTSCFEVSECRLSLSATVVGGVELDDARLDESSVEEAKLLFSTNSDNDDMAGDLRFETL